MAWLKNRELLWQFTLRNIELRHKGSYLGWIWPVLNPLLMLSLYVFVFGYIFRGDFHVAAHESKLDFALGLFLGLALFQFIADVLAISPSVISGSPNLVKKVIFPLDVIPAANVGSALFHMLITLALALLSIVLVGPGLTLRALWLPVIVAPLILLALGISWACAALGVFFRDFMQLVGFLSQILMYASGIFYSAANIPHAGWLVLRFNPMLLAIEMARDVTLWERPINMVRLGYLWGASVVMCIAGWLVFRQLAPRFADEL